MTLRLDLFGSPRIDCDGASLALPFERRSQLVALLALKRSWVARPELAATLWPEQAHKQACSNLRKTLFRLQSQPWASAIDVQGNAVRLEADTDVFDFEAALRERRIADALPLRRGELLAGFDDDRSEAWSSWLSFERDRMRVAWRGAALDRLAADIDPAEGIGLSAQLLDADPLDEAALRAHMLWLAQNGQSAAARHVYQAFAERLAQDLGLGPGAELKALHESLGASSGRIGSAVGVAPLAPDDGFIGRSVELRRIAELLAQTDCRLLCLVGPGGVGKTRLAQRAIQELAPQYPDGVAFVSLEDVALSSELGVRLARETGVALSGTREPADQVIELLRERHMLLVLDNFEQLAGDVSILDKLLQGCAWLKIIVTSRVRLVVAAAWLLPLGGLPCPEPEDQDRIEAFDAVRLFVKAAKRVAPAINPAAEAVAIVEICAQVEGLPLALQLAATWTRVLSCAAIATELRHGTELLCAVNPTLPGRHGSIEHVFEQSWQLLTATERDALARLSVFRGGFAVEAARDVAGASLPVLGALTDNSLLRKDGARVFLHPLLQQLAALRLGDGEARASTEAVHARYFHRLLAQLRSPLENGERDAMRQMDAEFENCRIAWRWAIAHEETEALARSAPALLRFCDNRGRFMECLALLREAIKSRPPRADARFEPLLSSAAAHFECRLDRYGDAKATAARALVASRTTRDHDTRLMCFKVLGVCCYWQGRPGAARRYFKRALRQAPAPLDPCNAANMLDNLALIEKAIGRRDEALRMSLQALVQRRSIGDIPGEAVSLCNLGVLQCEMGDHESAATHLKTGLAVCDCHDLVNIRGDILSNLTMLAIKTGDYGSAQANAERALEDAVRTGARALESEVKMHLARMCLWRGDRAAARCDLRASLELAIAIGRPSYQLAGAYCFAEILAAQGELDCARKVLVFVVKHPSTYFSDRNEIRQRLTQWHPAAGGEPAWPGFDLGELVQRIVAETPVAYAPLIAIMRGAR
jgi:predicted ATPase/DNA-binding SARP family transcriptional activator